MTVKTQLSSLLTNKRVRLGGGALLVFATGAASSYLVTKKLLEVKYEKIATMEIAEAKTYYSALNKTGSYSDPVKVLESRVKNLGYSETSHSQRIFPDVTETPKATEVELETEMDDDLSDDILIDTDLIEPDMLVVSDKPVTRAKGVIQKPLFENPSDFDYEEEIQSRDIDTPYVISHDEFYEGEKEYDQNSVTYFEGDGVLVDERDSPIDDTDMTVGDPNLQRFGHGSLDNNIVYVRNERLEIDFEVARSPGEYVKEVLGFIEHSQQSDKVRRFRSEDG